MANAFCYPDVIRNPAGGRYIVQDMKGMGGQRIVYLALFNGNSPMCIKCFNKPDLALARLEKHVSDEVRRVCQGTHALLAAHVINIEDAFEFEGNVFVTEPYCPGGSLADQITDNQPMPPATAAFIVRKLVRAVMALHIAGFVHRDVKPDNILFGQLATQLFLTDLGLATAVNCQGLAAATPGYASPQQLRNLAASVADDIYSIGATLYQLIVGLRPFQCADPDEEVHLTLDPVRPAIPAREFVSIPDGVNSLLSRALSKQPHQRPSLREIHDELSRL